MKKLLYITAIALLSVVSFTACESFLIAENKAAGSDADQYFSTEEGLYSFKAIAYSGLKSLVTNTDINEWGTDIYTAVRTGDPGAFHRYTITAEDGTVKSYYTSTYAMINDANGILLYGGDDGKYAAEAKFLRNYGYYLLTQQFGCVPYITHYIHSAERNYPRTSLDTIYTSMIAELESIAHSENLPDRSEGSYLGIASKRAVAALLSKVYLAAGWDLQTKLTDAAQGKYEVLSTQYFEKAAQWADAAIDNQNIEISFADKWSPKNENNVEEIFSVQYERDGYPGNLLTGGHGLQNTFGHSYGDVASNGLKICNAKLAPSTKAIYLWEKGDSRWDGTFMRTMYNAHKDEDGKVTWTTEGYYAYYNNPDTAHLNIVLAYFPYYANREGVISWVRANQSRFIGTGYANKTGKVFIMSDPMLRLDIKENGEIGNQITLSYQEGRTYSNASVTSKKYDDPDTEQDAGNTSVCYRDIVVFHLSDMYLTSAEAHLMANHDQEVALSKINAVRQRAGASLLSSFDSYTNQYTLPEDFELTPLDVILDEKAREMFGENEGRWVDLRRTKQMVRYNLAFNEYTPTVADMSDNKGNIRWLRPIPAAEISSNNGISESDQNLGY